MIQLAAGGNYVAYEWGAPVVTLADVLAPIGDYYLGSYLYNRETNSWTSGWLTHVMQPGEHWFIDVSQACPLENFRWWTMHINEVIVASSAVAGATVPVEVLLYNFRPETITFRCNGEADGVVVEFPDTLDCSGGEVGSVSGYFTMPDKDVILTVSGCYWVGSECILDDWRKKTIALAAPPGILEQLIPMIMLVMMMGMIMPMMEGG